MSAPTLVPTVLRIAYAALAWLAIGLGTVHVSFTPAYSAELTQASLWFASGGLLMIVTGALNLLNRRYGIAAPGLRRVAIATNVVMTGFAVAQAVVMRPGAILVAVVVGLFAGLTACSLLPAGAPPQGVTSI
jgi:hypothetical protein